MWSQRRFRRRELDTEALLRAQRAEPRDEFVRDLDGRLRAERPVKSPTAWSRLAFAGSVCSLIVGMFAAVGGFSYAAAGATSTYSVVKEVVVDHHVTLDVAKSSADEQYPGTPAAPAEPPKQDVAGNNNVAGQTAGVAAAETLPFTGISLLSSALIGAVLLALGLILRRRERRTS
jgi:hypothetical protein